MVDLHLIATSHRLCFTKRILILSVIPTIAATFGCGRYDVNNLTAEDWHKDLHYLASTLPKRHVDFYHTVSKDSFERTVADLDRRISFPQLSRFGGGDSRNHPCCVRVPDKSSCNAVQVSRQSRTSNSPSCSSGIELLAP